MSDCKHETVVRAGNARTLEIGWECLKCGIEFSPTAAARADGIEAARRAVGRLEPDTDPTESSEYIRMLAIHEAQAAIDALTADAPETEGEGGE